MRHAVTWLATIAVTMVVPGCGTGEEPPAPAVSASVLCGGPATSVQLGDPVVDRAPSVAEFETTGGPLHITARHYPRTGWLDPKRGRTGFYFGPIDKLPSYNPNSNVVTPVTLQLDVDEGRWGEFTLPAGRYWLLISAGGDVEIASCTPGGVTGKPAPVVNHLRPSTSPSPSRSR